MATIVTYDISDGHTQVKNDCLAAGFEDCIIAGQTWYRLPNTTLRHPDSDRAVVSNKFKAAVRAASAALRRPIVIEKLYLVEQGPGLIDSDEECEGAKSR